MILVLSFDQYEQGTDPVIDWLLYYKAKFVKITIQDLIQTRTRFQIDINNGRVFVEGVDITDEVKVIWYRRFEAELDVNISPGKHVEQAVFELKHEVEVTVEFLKQIFRDKIWMPHFSSIKLEKPEITYLAQSINMPTPKSIITNNKRDVENFYDSVGDLIIKPIRHSSYFVDGDRTFSIYTQKLNKAAIDGLPDRFVLTLFQELIDAEYEIRVFYLDGTCYSTAILISDRSSDIVDVKLHYESASINWVTYKLPDEYEQKIGQLMDTLNLNTGSLDIIKAKNGGYIMLEVNPVGQYNAPGYRCNYNLEEKIAKWLCDHD